MRIRLITAVFVVLALSLVPVASAGAATGDGPAATKAGTLINYVSAGKLKIAKKITILLVCSADCQVDATTTLVAPGPNLIARVSGPLAAGVLGGPFIKPNGPLLRAMKAEPGKYKLRSTVTATNLSTGASETVSRTFRLKR